MATKKNKGTDVNLKGILNTLEDTEKETISDTKEDIIQDINTKDHITNEAKEDTNSKFILKKKADDKKGKKAFNVYMADGLVKELDKISKKSGYSRNELINLMCEYCANNMELVEDEK